MKESDPFLSIYAVCNQITYPRLRASVQDRNTKFSAARMLNISAGYWVPSLSFSSSSPLLVLGYVDAPSRNFVANIRLMLFKHTLLVVITAPLFGQPLSLLSVISFYVLAELVAQCLVDKNSIHIERYFDVASSPSRYVAFAECK